MPKQSKLNQPLTFGQLAEFTEKTILPAVADIVDKTVEEKLETKLEEKLEKLETRLEKKFAVFRNEIKDYFDRKLAETKGDIIAVIKGDRERDRTFKIKLLEIVKRNKLANPKELEFLVELIR